MRLPLSSFEAMLSSPEIVAFRSEPVPDAEKKRCLGLFYRMKILHAVEHVKEVVLSEESFLSKHVTGEEFFEVAKRECVFAVSELFQSDSFFQEERDKIVKQVMTLLQKDPQCSKRIPIDKTPILSYNIDCMRLKE